MIAAAAPLYLFDCVLLAELRRQLAWRQIVEGIELLVLLVLFLIGYWAVDFFWPKKTESSAAPAASLAWARKSTRPQSAQRGVSMTPTRPRFADSANFSQHLTIFVSSRFFPGGH